MHIGLVLIVDDEDLILDLLQVSLEDGGFEVLPANNGRAALTAVQEAKELKAVITDIRLGNGPNGWEVAHAARHRFRDVAIIYMSGASGHDWMENGVPKSICIQKPFAPSQIVTGVATLLNKADL